MCIFVFAISHFVLTLKPSVIIQLNTQHGAVYSTIIGISRGSQHVDSALWKDDSSNAMIAASGPEKNAAGRLRNARLIKRGASAVAAAKNEYWRMGFVRCDCEQNTSVATSANPVTAIPVMRDLLWCFVFISWRTSEGPFFQSKRSAALKNMCRFSCWASQNMFHPLSLAFRRSSLYSDSVKKGVYCPHLMCLSFAA